MAEPRKVPFVTLSAFAAGPASDPRKRRNEDEAGINLEESTGVSTTATGAGGGGLFGKASDGDNGEPRGITVRLNLCLSEPNDQASAEFNYSELVQSIQVMILCGLGRVKAVGEVGIFGTKSSICKFWITFDSWGNVSCVVVFHKR